ncbi:MAG: DUF3667 domain-containing protein [Pirellulaceae bacterium]
MPPPELTEPQISVSSTPRVSMQMVWEELLAFASLEKGTLHTIYRLLRRPGGTIRAFLAGERGKLTNPLRFLAMSTAFITVMFVLFMPRDEIEQQMQMGAEAVREEMDEKLVDSEVVPSVSVQQIDNLLEVLEVEGESRIVRSNASRAREILDEQIWDRLSEIYYSWMNVFLLLALPVNSVLTRIAFTRSGLNFAEHLVVNSFILGLQNFVAVMTLVPRVSVLPEVMFVGYVLLSFGFQFIAWRQVFDVRGILGNLLNLTMIVFSVAFYMILQGIGMAALVFRGVISL